MYKPYIGIGGYENMDDFKLIKDILDDIENLLEGFLLSGINIVQESSLEDLEKTAERLQMIGMEEGKKIVLDFKGKLSSRRHKIDFEDMDLILDLSKLETYIEAAALKINLEMAKQKIYEDVVK